MSLLWLLPIEKIPAKIGGPALIVVGALGLLSEPEWGGFVITIGMGVCAYAVIKSRITIPKVQNSSSAQIEDDEKK
ncbi:hypothetical protein [Sulfuriferula nivalis]|uniref:Uncharacterized protein n=1 Tax=Sulfuriferula nivalis TaxID=2675298 RepID=A0A809RK77_9PROT|nr:hypothetical protein [Sulfuriferula nivalis]BBP02359.1 hypothetical protein SFSGTM_30670 [Sulfuriferula nivalis]